MDFVAKSELQHTGLSWFVPGEGNKQEAFEVCVISSFDGVHRQHQKLLQYAIEKTSGKDPSRVLVLMLDDEKSSTEGVLLTPEERTWLISRLVSSEFTFGRLDFSGDISPGTSRKPFYQLSQFLSRTGLLIPGDDISFKEKADAQGSGSLYDLASEMGIAVDMRFAHGQFKDNTSLICKALAAGDISRANELLGYAYSMSGIVVKGNKIGRTLGYPTANLKTGSPHKVVPRQGVYTAVVLIKGQWHQSMVNIGIRPTLDMKNLTIEAHLFDFNENIYDEEISIHFIGRTRDEMRFSTLAELRQQLNADKRITREMLQELANKYTMEMDLLLIND